MKIGIIGLGKMGGPIAKKLHSLDANLIVYDANPLIQQEWSKKGFNIVQSIAEVSAYAQIIWIMVPVHSCRCCPPRIARPHCSRNRLN